MSRTARKATLNRYWRNVPLPEPYLSLLACGFILQRIWPCRFPLNRGSRQFAGSLLLAGGGALVCWAVSAAAETNLARSSRLVTQGPYALSRHPMYVGWTMFYFGLALVTDTCRLLSLSPLLLAWVHFVALGEESKLESHYGEDYQTYAKRVRRYV